MRFYPFQAQMTNQTSPVEEQEKLLDEALNIVKVQVNFIIKIILKCLKVFFASNNQLTNLKVCLNVFIVGISDEEMPGQIEANGCPKARIHYAGRAEDICIIT